MDKNLVVSPTPAKFAGHRDHGNVDMLLVCHLILLNHVTKKYSNMMGRSLQSLATILPSLSTVFKACVHYLLSIFYF